MKNKKKLGIISAVLLVVFVVVWLVVCGYLWSWGPFSSISNLKFVKLDGNGNAYSIEEVKENVNSPLSGKKICFLGSSVTYGASSLQVSFADYIAKRNNAQFVKEAVSGTTLVDEGIDSYISRMKKLDRNIKFDLLVCQLSTNDATQKKNFGEISKDDNFDTKTICGAIEYIITYAKETWNCPVAFYTNSYYESEAYSKMVDLLFEIAEKYDITVIDLYTDKSFNDISQEERNLYMADKIHPTQAGYLKWWTPKIEKDLYEIFK